MRRPRPVAMTGAERRALRVIEQALTEEDSRLSLLLEALAAADRPARCVRTMTWIYVAVSLVVLVFGLVVDEPGARDTGVIMVVFMPAGLLCAAEAVRRWR